MCGRYCTSMSHVSFGILALDVDLIIQAKIICRLRRAFFCVFVFFISFIACAPRGGCPDTDDAYSQFQGNSLSTVTTCPQIYVHGKLQLQILLHKIQQLDRVLPCVCLQLIFFIDIVHIDYSSNVYSIPCVEFPI